MGRDQPSTTCDVTKIPGFGWLGTIMVSEYNVMVREYRVGKWKRGRGQMVHGSGREADLKR